ncbi:MAG TPA: extracellular solute-binding protein [Actinomycetales bacterium]|nr:extracellular solute-binding protein [Actinomycetales bacterium]
MRTRPLVPVLVVALGATLSACGGDAGGADGDALVIYSGRSEALVGPILDRLEEAVDVPVEVRYGASSTLAAQLLEEGDATEADVFFSQDAGALGALAKEGMLEPLPESVTSLVPEDYTDDEGRWVATTARARVLSYDPAQAPEVAEFSEIDQILDPKYSGEIGYAPTNASFHAFVTALRIDRGDDGARQWLESFAALDPEAFENNTAVLEATDGGEVSIGLINHYYWYRLADEVGAENVNAQIRFLDSDDPGALVNVAGAGVIAGSDQAEAANAAIEYLLSEDAQKYFADETAEYPVVEGVSSTTFDLEPLAELDSHQIDLNELDSLDETLALLGEVGLT